jgi:ABC-type antimicrobial peptide transport system permease subunit
LAFAVLGRALLTAALGVAGGLAVSTALVSSLRALLFGVTPLDPLTFAAAGVVLCAAALAAGAIPLRRVLSLEPLTALRHE